MRARAPAGAAVGIALLVAGSATTPAGGTATTPVPTAAGPAGPAGTAAGPGGGAGAGPGSGAARAAADLAARGTAADAFARVRGGRTGIVIRDRLTGATCATRPGPPAGAASAAPRTTSNGS